MSLIILNRQIIHYKQIKLALLFLLGIAVICKINPKNPFRGGSVYGSFIIHKEGYDAKTGKWIGKKPSKFSFAVTPDTYERVKNWYATDSGTNNPNHLQVEPPKEGYTYIYTPYKDSAHKNIRGMSILGAQGYKGYWYADDLSKATDSTDPGGENVIIAPPKQKPEDNKLVYGGYDARTGKWLNTQPSSDAFAVSSGTYERVKNWFATNFGANNPLGLRIEVPREDFVYIYVPFNDPAHPGVVGMSFMGGTVFKGYWYADKATSIIGDYNPGNISNAPVDQAIPPPQPSQNPPVEAPTNVINTKNDSVSAPRNNNSQPQQQAVPPSVNQSNEGNQPK